MDLMPKEGFLMEKKGRLAWLFALIAVMAVLVAGCGSSSGGESSATTTAAGDATETTVAAGGDTTETTAAPDTADLSALTGKITGAGSSFQDGFDQRIITDFAKEATGASVVYQKSGSSDGKQQLADGTVDFAGSDSAIKDDEALAAKKADVLYFPTVLGPITVSYNLPDVTDLQLSAETLAKIMQAEITTWDDAAIKADNPDATLPSTKITVVHRSDGSGTTSNFTKYLAAAAPDVWKLTPGETVDWPASTQGAEKNSGVATSISQTAGAVGYVDLIDAAKAKLAVAAIKNSDGKFVKPTPAGASAAAAGAEIADDLTYNPLNASGADSYPITSPTWILVYKSQKDPAKAELLRQFLTYALTTGQAAANEVLYAPLPSDLAAKALAQVDQITG